MGRGKPSKSAISHGRHHGWRQVPAGDGSPPMTSVVDCPWLSLDVLCHRAVSLGGYGCPDGRYRAAATHTVGVVFSLLCEVVSDGGSGVVVGGVEKWR